MEAGFDPTRTGVVAAATATIHTARHRKYRQAIRFRASLPALVVVVFVASIAATMLPPSSSLLTSSLGKKTTAVLGARAFRLRPVGTVPRSTKSLGGVGGGSSGFGFGPSTTSRLLASVTGPVYDANPNNAAGASGSAPANSDKRVTVTLYTKEGCTLCDRVKDVLAQLRDEPGCGHALRQVDITDDDQTASWDRYKYDIPVLHIRCGGDGTENDGSDGDVYWTKHRLTEEEAREALAEARTGSFRERRGRPNAAAMER